MTARIAGIETLDDPGDDALMAFARAAFRTIDEVPAREIAAAEANERD